MFLNSKSSRLSRLFFYLSSIGSLLSLFAHDMRPACGEHALQHDKTSLYLRAKHASGHEYRRLLCLKESLQSQAHTCSQDTSLQPAQEAMNPNIHRHTWRERSIVSFLSRLEASKIWRSAVSSASTAIGPAPSSLHFCEQTRNSSRCLMSAPRSVFNS